MREFRKIAMVLGVISGFTQLGCKEPETLTLEQKDLLEVVFTDRLLENRNTFLVDSTLSRADLEMYVELPFSSANLSQMLPFPDEVNVLFGDKVMQDLTRIYLSYQQFGLDNVALDGIQLIEQKDIPEYVKGVMPPPPMSQIMDVIYLSTPIIVDDRALVFSKRWIGYHTFFSSNLYMKNGNTWELVNAGRLWAKSSKNE